LTALGLPLEGSALIAGIDRILDMPRTSVNVTGDMAVTVVVDKSEKSNEEPLY
jgi:Na+/H+-dicarboxylate symporter